MKKKILVIFGIGDVFCSESSPRCIRKGKTGPSVVNGIKKLINKNGKDYYGYLIVNEPLDTFNNVNVVSGIKKSKVIKVKLCSRGIFNVNNQLIVTDHDDISEIVLDGDQLDYILRPEDFEIHVVGIDINGIFSSFIHDTLKKKYSVTVFSDMIRAFNKDTITNMINIIKDRKRDVELVFRKS